MAVEQNPASIYITDLTGKIEYVNEKFVATTGYPRSEAIGQDSRILRLSTVDVSVYTELWETIESGRSWQGDTVEVQTTEYVNGEPVQMREKFRVYGSYAESFNDYANLIRNNARFSGVVGQTDGTQFARSLQQSGYATDPMYADKLSRIINGTTLRQALAG